MENSNTPENRIIDINNPWKFCSDLDPRYHRNCARYQSQIFLGQFGKPNSINLVGKYCSLGQTTLLKETCFESLGYYIAQNSLGNPDLIWQSCSQMPDSEGQEICAVGGATETVFQRYGDFKSSSREICMKIKEPRESQCLNRMNQNE